MVVMTIKLYKDSAGALHGEFLDGLNSVSQNNANVNQVLVKVEGFELTEKQSLRIAYETPNGAEVFDYSQMTDNDDDTYVANIPFAVTNGQPNATWLLGLQIVSDWVETNAYTGYLYKQNLANKLEFTVTNTVTDLNGKYPTRGDLDALYSAAEKKINAENDNADDIKELKTFKENAGKDITDLQGEIFSLPSRFISNGEKGQANGLATLDASGKVPQSQLPDDIGLTLGETAGTAYEGAKGAKNARDIASLQKNKQDVLKAGENITISADGTISATGGGGTVPEGFNPADYVQKTGDTMTGALKVGDGHSPYKTEVSHAGVDYPGYGSYDDSGNAFSLTSDGLAVYSAGRANKAIYKSKGILLGAHSPYDLLFPELMKDETIATEEYVQANALSKKDPTVDGKVSFVGSRLTSLNSEELMIDDMIDNGVYAYYRGNHIHYCYQGSEHVDAYFPTNKTGNQTFAMLSDIEDTIGDINAVLTAILGV